MEKEIIKAGITYKLTSNNEYRVEKCDSFAKDIVIPEKLEGIPVAHIGNRAFYQSRIQSIKLPDTIKSIGVEAFFKCQFLVNFTFPKNLRFIYDNAFAYCDNLTVLNVNDMLKYIKPNAFYGCTELKIIEISSVSSWQSIDFGNACANPLYYARKLFVNGIVQKRINLIKAPVGEYSFPNCELDTVFLADGMTLAPNMFAYAKIKELNFPEKRVEIFENSEPFVNAEVNTVVINEEKYILPDLSAQLLADMGVIEIMELPF
jgi:hypothetical protein